MEFYFQTLICNSCYFRNTIVNGDLRYFVWDDTPGLDPLVLDESHFENMVNNSATFARRFEEDAPVLKKLDDELLNRSSVQLVPGVWCPNLGKEQGGIVRIAENRMFRHSSLEAVAEKKTGIGSIPIRVMMIVRPQD
ncbi:beta-glucuronosyltransferase GlcAT14A-like [Phragmites australis]|uniref:beta-glucuronosyltransferase GlcAT14A-like n=1 Tax=Phragmites australis TaxID=29695 RepID=UPI002D767DA7|nr:beta-glucuronosyltransferase GlcAT14A-like [Phragmites australis]